MNSRFSSVKAIELAMPINRNTRSTLDAIATTLSENCDDSDGIFVSATNFLSLERRARESVYIGLLCIHSVGATLILVYFIFPHQLFFCFSRFVGGTACH